MECRGHGLCCVGPWPVPCGAMLCGAAAGRPLLASVQEVAS